jgi:NAD(P)-dependent dehydrogenase (short-subunit alcohol dehydrogenase family)
MAGLGIAARSALVTGSPRGIGRGVALRLAGCGVARIGVHYLKNRDAAEETARLLRERGPEAVLLPADATRPEGIARMFAEARAAGLGPLGVFVANGCLDSPPA